MMRRKGGTIAAALVGGARWQSSHCVATPEVFQVGEVVLPR